MRNRLLGLISQARAALAEAAAHGQRRQELIADLLRAQKFLRDAQEQQTRRGWLAAKHDPDPVVAREIEERQLAVTRLKDALDRATLAQNAAANRGGELRLIICRIGASVALARGQAVFGGDPDEGDIDSLEQRLLRT
jgi:hypothetical protein